MNPGYPISPEDLAQAAWREMGSGRPQAAADLAAQALRLHPDNARALLVIGILTRESGDLDGAIRHLTRAVERDPRDARANYHLALAHHRKRGGHDAARALYERSLQLDPDSADANAMFAKLLEETNELDRAERYARRALQAAPRHTTARLVLAVVDRRLKRYDDARRGFESLLHDKGGAPARSLGTLALSLTWNHYAKTLDALAEYDLAYDAFARAHQIFEPVARASGADPARPVRLLERTREYLTQDRFDRWAAYDPADPTPDPIFVVGFPRSGTTLTEQIFAAHPGVVTLDEDSPLTDLSRLLGEGAPNDPYPASLDRVADAQVPMLRKRYFDGIAKRLGSPPGARTLVDKLPLTLLHVPLICRVFPRARLVLPLRDPRDVCTSCFMQVMVHNDAMANLTTTEDAAAFYVKVMGFWLEIRDRLPLPWFELRYERLTDNPAGTLRAMCDAIALPWDDALLHHHEQTRGRSISTPSYAAVSTPINTSARGRWRHYESRMTAALDRLAPILGPLGYEPDSPRG